MRKSSRFSNVMSRRAWIVAAMSLAAGGAIPSGAFAQVQDSTVDQFVFYFSGATSTNGVAMGGFAPSGSTKFYTGGFSGTGQALREITYSGGSWSGLSNVGQTDWNKLLLSSNVSAGTIPGANTASNPTITNVQLNPASLTIGGITYAPGTLAIQGEAIKTSTSGTVNPTDSKLLYAYDLRAVTYDGMGNPNAVAAPGTRDYNNDGIIQWNDVFFPIVSFQDQKNLNPSQTSTSNNVARRMAFTSDGQSMYLNDSSTAYGGIYKVNLTAVGSMSKLVTSSQINTEPGVVPTTTRDFGAGFGAGDQVIFQGGSDIGNNGGLSYVVDTGSSVSSARTLITAKQFAHFFDFIGATADIRGVATDSSGNLYLMNASSPNGIYMYDSLNRLVKVNSGAEQRVFDKHQGVTYNLNQLDTIVRTSPVNASVNEILYNDSGARAPVGVTVYMPGDFNRDNAVDASDVTLMKYVLNGQDPFNIAHPALTGSVTSLRGTVMGSIATATPFAETNSQIFRFDLNGSFASGSTVAVSVDWKDVKIFQQYAGLSDGDVNMDYAVDNTDLTTIGSNYGGTSKTFLQGNLTSVRIANSDKDDVNFADLVTLAANWTAAKPALAAVGSISSADMDRAFSVTAGGTLNQYTAKGSGAWSIAANWSSGVPNGNGAVVSLLTKPQDDVVLSVDGSYTLGQLNFDNYFSYTLNESGGILRMNNSGGTAEINAFASSPLINVPVELQSGTNVTVTYAADVVTFAGAISSFGLNGLTKSGAGTVLLSGNNTYAGNTLVSAGTLLAKKALSLPGYNVAGKVDVSTGATLSVNSNGHPEWRTNQIDTLRANANFAAGSQLGIDTSNAITYSNLQYGSNIGGALGITKLGGTTLTLSGTNTYTGSTLVNAGTLAATRTAALPGYNVAGKVQVASGATLAVNVGGAGQWVSGDIDTLRTNATFASGAALGIDTTGGNFTYASNIAGAGLGVTKIGSGVLTLTGTNSYTGPTAVNFGALQLDFAGAGAPVNNIVASGSALQLNGGSLLVNGKASTSNSQTVAGATINAGSSVVTMTAAASNPVVLVLGAITRNVGGTVDVNLPAGTPSATNGITTTTTVSSNILGGHITVGKTDWAGKSGNNIIPLAPGSYTNDSWAAGTNTTVTTSSSPASGSTTNTLRFNAAGASTVTLAGTNTITTGGILVTANVGGSLSSIGGGTLIGRSAVDLVIHQHNTSGGLTIGSTIADNTTATGLTKSGAGLATLTGPLTYTGATTVNQGRLLLQTNLTAGASVNVTGGTLELATGGGNNRVIKSPSVAVSNGKIDIQDNKIITNTSVGGWNGVAYNGIQGLVQSGLGSGVFDGTTGIITSQTDATNGSGLTTIGVSTGAEKFSLGPTDTAIWGGQTVTGSSTLAMYTYAGDADLSGFIDGTDYFFIDSNVGVPQADGYANGDFNYDGVIDGTDYFYIDSNIIAQGAPFATSESTDLLAGVTAVPEPAMFGLVVLAAPLLGRRRRSGTRQPF